MSRPNVLFIMTDQQRFDSIRSLGNADIYTPNLDRLVKRGVTFSNGYSTCPVCAPARLTIRTGCEPPTTRQFSNSAASPLPGQPPQAEERCGPYLARRMRECGYRTFGIGKFHSNPWNEDLGYDVHLHSEELYRDPAQRQGDAYAAWIANKHPAYDYVEGLMGERTEMYYMPQISAQPAEMTVERWAADRAVEQIQEDDQRPYFGFVSFVGPHPPLAPPIPFNRMYDPDRMPNPIRGDLATDHMDEQIPFMNYAIWADDINDSHARVLRARYYGEISFIDQCLGQILDSVEAQADSDNTLICFFSDHGDHMGDHTAWQKESFFECSTHIPFLLSWPQQITANQQRADLVCLTDLFGIATHAAGEVEVRDGVDVLGALTGQAAPRDHLLGYYGLPGTPQFKIMVRDETWKYIFFANGGGEQLFNLNDDPNELQNLVNTHDEQVARLRAVAIQQCQVPGAADALDNDDLKAFPFAAMERKRIYQFDRSRGVMGFPEKPEDVLKS
ncbi:MAG: sulfatase-like hydrolase/transferase [Chloroflexota bacterium]